MEKLQDAIHDPASSSSEDWKTAVSALVQVGAGLWSHCEADESFAKQRIQQMESELARLRANLANAAALADEVSSLRDAKQQLESQVEGLERERGAQATQISRAVDAFELIESELRDRIQEVEALKETLSSDQTLIAKLEVGLLRTTTEP